MAARAQVFEIKDADNGQVMGYVFSFSNDPRGPLVTLEGDGLGKMVTGVSQALMCDGRAVEADWWGEREF